MRNSHTPRTHATRARARRRKIHTSHTRHSHSPRTRGSLADAGVPLVVRRAGGREDGGRVGRWRHLVRDDGVERPEAHTRSRRIKWWSEKKAAGRVVCDGANERAHHTPASTASRSAQLPPPPLDLDARRSGVTRRFLSGLRFRKLQGFSPSGPIKACALPGALNANARLSCALDRIHQRPKPPRPRSSSLRTCARRYKLL